jgi:hypothetical protein
MQKIIHFIKYNNATVIILAVILILGGGALAAGPEAIGQKQTSLEGLDNTALLAVDLANFSMDFKISKIEEDDKFYYVTYTYLDLTVINSAWQHQLNEKTRKITKKLKEDLGIYLAGQLKEESDARLKILRAEQAKALAGGPAARVEVTAYSGLIGKTLDLAANVFPGYEPVKKIELPAPVNPLIPASAGEQNAADGTDNLIKIYNDYLAEHPEIFAAPVEPAPAATASSTPDSAAPVDTAVPETPAIPEPESVDIIELPASPASEPSENAASASTPEPAPAESEPAQ